LTDIEQAVEPTVGDALRVLRKLAALESDGARLIYLGSFVEKAVETERSRILAIVRSDVGNSCYTSEPTMSEPHPCTCWREQLAAAIEAGV
jgi:hypothetical protein